MNFLEQLTAEWYQYNGYLVSRNLRFGRNANGRGGHVGEMDVIAYEPRDRKFIHLEASTDSDSWSERKIKFERKFTDARKYYREVFPFKEDDVRPEQIAIVGFNRTHRSESTPWKSVPPEGSSLGEINIKIIHIPDFIKRITNELKKFNPEKEAISEGYPLLRAIQYTLAYKE